MKSEDSDRAWKYLVDEDPQLKCGYCGNVIENPGKAYALVLEIVNPTLCNGEGILWNSDPYCSEECFNKATDVILNNLRSDLLESGFAKRYIIKDGFNSKKF